MTTRSRSKGARFAALLLAGVLLAGCKDDSAAETDAHAGPTMNFHRIDADLATGGHFMDAGVAAVAEQGVTVVIDLRDEPPEGQKERLAAAGIEWFNVPVVWASPQLDDFAAFSQLMSEHEGKHVLVQCQANYRASAMTYLYRVTEGQVSEAEARHDLEKIWTPEGTWAAYMDEVIAVAEQ